MGCKIYKQIFLGILVGINWFIAKYGRVLANIDLDMLPSFPGLKFYQWYQMSGYHQHRIRATVIIFRNENCSEPPLSQSPLKRV